MFGDDAARVVVFLKAFQPLMTYRPYHPGTVTRYITQVKNYVSKIVAFWMSGAVFPSICWRPYGSAARAARAIKMAHRLGNSALLQNLPLVGTLGAFPDFGDWSYDSRVRRLGLSFRRLLRVIERMYRLNLSVYDVNPVKNMIHSINSLHVEKGCNVISLDDVLL